MGIHSNPHFGTLYRVGSKPLADAALLELRKRASTDDVTKELEDTKEAPVEGPFALYDDPELKQDHYVATGNKDVKKAIELQEALRSAHEAKDTAEAQPYFPMTRRNSISAKLKEAENKFKQFFSDAVELPDDIKRLQVTPEASPDAPDRRPLKRSRSH
jgi:hypothetical protein